MNVLRKDSGDQLGSIADPWAEVHGSIVYIAGTPAAKTNRALDTFGATTDTTDLDATTLKHGLMSKLDKIKLDAVNLASITDGDMLKATYDPTNINASAFELSNHTGTIATSQIADSSVTLAKMANTPTATMLGRVTAGTGVVEYLTASQVRTLLGIEAGATADQTGAEIKALYEAEADTNAFTDAEQAKLAGIEAAATADQTAAEILAALLTVDGAGSGLDADLLDGNNSAAFATAAQGTAADAAKVKTDYLTVTQAVDLDAIEAASHAAATVSGNGITIAGQQVSLDIGTGSTQVAAGDHAHAQLHDSLTLAGTPDYITIAGQVITRNAINLATHVTGILPHGNLGTGGGGSTKFLREDGTYQTLGGGGDALVASTLDQFADVTQAAGQTLAITASTTLAGGSHSGTNTGDQTPTSLGLVIGTHVQAYDGELAAIAGLTSAPDKGIQFTGAGTAAVYDLTAAGKALLDDADASAQRATLGLGGAALLAVGTTAGTVAAGDHNHSGVYQPVDTQLTDLAGLAYAGNTLKVVRVNAGETAFELATVSGGGDALVANYLDNGDFTVWQRGTTLTSAGTFPNSDDAYIADRWYLLSDGNDIVDVDKTQDSPGGLGYCLRLDVETVNKKFGVAQIIESINCEGIVGQTATFSFWAKVSATTKLDNIKCAVVSWTGTTDVVTSDLVSAWGVEGTNPTLIANATYENTPANLGVTTAWAQYSVTCAVDTSGAKNVAVMIWSDVTDTTLGDFLYITDVQLSKSASALPFERLAITTQEVRCMRYFEGLQGSGVVYGTTGNLSYVFWFYKVRKRVVPTFTNVGGTATIDNATIDHVGGYRASNYAYIGAGSYSTADL